MSVNEKMTNIADAIRENSTLTEQLTLDRMVFGVEQVHINGWNGGYSKGLADGHAIYYNEGYNKGLTDGKKEGYTEGHEAGKQAEYDAFWDAFQRNGRRKDYQYGFAGSGWSELIFKPKYKIAPTGSYDGKGLFFHFKVFDSTVLDYREIADMIDLTQVTNGSHIFNSALINYIDVDFSNATNLDACFSNEWTQTYRTHITLKVSEKCTSYVNTFLYSSALTHLLFKEGSVISRSLSVSAATNLVLESAKSVISALKDYSGDSTNAFKYTITFSSNTRTLLDNAGAIFPNNTTWKEYCESIGWNY